MIQVENLSKTFGNIKALDNISFNIGAGEVVGLLGPNGAGKSTAMNIVTGYLSSTNGIVTIDGYEILEEPKLAKSKIGYLPEIPPLYTEMTVIKYLEFVYDLKKITLPKKAHIKEVMDLVKISDVSGRLIRNLSKGYKQRVGFAQALIGNPPILILDEPTAGLDPKQIIEIRNLIKQLGKKHTVIFSSHVLSEISATCDRIIVIANGKLVADARTSELSTALEGEQRLLLEIKGEQANVLKLLNSINKVKKVRTVRSVTTGIMKYSVEYPPEEDIRIEVFKAMANANMPILSMESGGQTLEESFLKLTSGVAPEFIGGKDNDSNS